MPLYSGVQICSGSQLVAPALQPDSGLMQSEGMPREPWGYLPDHYVNQGKNEKGNVMTYEHD